MILVPYALGEDLTELTVTFVVLELRETLQVVDVLQVTAADCWASGLLLDRLRLFFVDGLSNLRLGDGFKELLAFVNLEGFNWRLLFLDLGLLHGRFCGSNVFGGRLLGRSF